MKETADSLGRKLMSNKRYGKHHLKINTPLMQDHISNQVKGLFSDPQSHRSQPLLEAVYLWNKISAQLQEILGPEVHQQWFSRVIPIVISNDVLILQGHGKFATYWISAHYQDLVDTLIEFHDQNLSVFFLSPSDLEEKIPEKDTSQYRFPSYRNAHVH